MRWLSVFSPLRSIRHIFQSEGQGILFPLLIDIDHEIPGSRHGEIHVMHGIETASRFPNGRFFRGTMAMHCHPGYDLDSGFFYAGPGAGIAYCQGEGIIADGRMLCGHLECDRKEPLIGRLLHGCSPCASASKDQDDRNPRIEHAYKESHF